jgi:membrane protein DedA with SNARE-associated domain
MTTIGENIGNGFSTSKDDWEMMLYDVHTGRRASMLSALFVCSVLGFAVGALIGFFVGRITCGN